VTHAPLSRRTFLRGTGVALALPLLDAMQPRTARAAAAAAPRHRIVAVNVGLGLHTPNLFPTTAGRDYEPTPYLRPLADLRDDFTVISGTSHPDVDGGHLAEKSFLTAAPHPSSASFRNSISIDQLAAERIGVETRFGYLALSLAGRGLSVSRSGVEIPTETRPSQVFANLFLEGKPDEKARRVQRLREGESVMDVVLDRARRMEQRLGPADRRKLDEYFTAVRETEVRLVKGRDWEARPKPAVAEPQPRDIDDKTDVIGRARLMYDMTHLALRTDSTRLVTFFANGINAVPQVDGVTSDYHNLSHHGRDEEKLEELAIVEVAQMTALRDFLLRLRETAEADANLLDRTMVLFGSNLGNASSHDTRNLPILLAGGGFRHGQHLRFEGESDYPLPNLFTSMLQRLGLEIDGFASSTGTMRGLEVRA
jgi:hypothetical protein